jgi:hypothetical protein
VMLRILLRRVTRKGRGVHCRGGQGQGDGLHDLFYLLRLEVHRQTRGVA